MLKIALSGSTGLVGTRITELLDDDYDFIHLLQSAVDITDEKQTHNAIQAMDFDIFLHLAAYTDVDGAEKNKDLAHKINVDGTRHVFDAVTDKKKKFIYVSTDFVFDGTSPPYFENSVPNPLSYYAKTKYEGENIVKDKSLIVRLSYPYRAKYDLKKDLVMGIRSSLESNRQLNMVTDSAITPTFIDDIAFALKYCFDNFSEGLIHLVGGNSLSPYDTGKLIAKTFSLDESLIHPTAYDEYFINKALRPRYSEIKTANNNFHKMRSFEEGLNEVVKQLQ